MWFVLHDLGGKGSHEEVHRLWALGTQRQGRRRGRKRGRKRRRAHLRRDPTREGRSQKGMTTSELWFVFIFLANVTPLYFNFTMCMFSLPTNDTTSQKYLADVQGISVHLTPQQHYVNNCCLEKKLPLVCVCVLFVWISLKFCSLSYS